MNILNTLKSNGIFLFATLFVIVDLIIIFGLKQVEARWTILWIEILALFFYIMAQSISGKDETIWFLKKKKDV